MKSTEFSRVGQHQDWFDDNDADIINLIAEKNGLLKAYMDVRTDATKTDFLRCRRLVQQRLREMKDVWMVRRAEEIQGSGVTTLLTEQSQILKRWAKHFRSVLNCSSATSDAAIDQLPQVDTNNDLDLPPSLTETIRAVQQISSGKAPQPDAIPPEVYKHGGFRLMAELKTLPGDVAPRTSSPGFQRSDHRPICYNHGGISLLNIAGKIFVRILLNRLSGHLE
ncbi:unnamed protein product [Schistocephalus solidus]|uniref:Uncharacterized protein n=1 Tax=Schistocephalus solidus TaxID=70667 RepID=A0A183TSR9_SCHSO|nr:unnamed protein product [Schistocephalus solidus]